VNDLAKKNKKEPAQVENTAKLPQNIMSIGERVYEDKNIYINQNVYRTIHNFTLDKKVNESGGVLVGQVVEEFGKLNILIEGFIEARHSEATPTTLKFTHETWEYIHSQVNKKYLGRKIIGWIHTHPDFGIFLSEYDKFIQKNFFSGTWQIAYVIDPIQGEEGFYFWVNGNIERCAGFYIYDKTGTKLRIKPTEPAEDREEKNTSGWILKMAVVMLSIVTIIMFMIIVNMKNEINVINEKLKSYEQNMEIFNDIQNAIMNQVGPQDSGGAQTNSQSGNSK
jgi:proteasome lid subunit RPN8/RPN11